MAAIDTTSAEALQNYVRKFHNELGERAFYSFESLEMMNLITGLKGEIVLTDLIIGNLSKRANPNFRPLDNIIKYRPRVLKTVPVDIDFEINPKLLANSYLEDMRKAGQNGKDIPFEGQVMAGLANKVRQELEIASHQAVKKATPATDDLLIELFDGSIQIMKNIRSSGHLPVPVQGGAYTMASIGKNMNEMYESLGVEAKMMGVEAWGSRKNILLYIDYLNNKFPYQTPNKLKNKKGQVIGVELENGMGTLMTKPGYGASDLIFMTQPANLCWGTDDVTDSDTFKFVDQIKSIQATLQYRVGMEIRIADQDYLAINDL